MRIKRVTTSSGRDVEIVVVGQGIPFLVLVHGSRSGKGRRRRRKERMRAARLKQNVSVNLSTDLRG